MSDILRDGNDIQIVDGDLKVIENSQSVVQLVRERLQSFAFEWFLDEDGLPYFQDLFGKIEDVEYAKTLISSTISSTEGVASVDRLNLLFDTDTRELMVEADITTVYNEVSSVVVSQFQAFIRPDALVDTEGRALLDFSGDVLYDLSGG